MTPVPVFPYKSEPNTENWIGVPGAGKTVPIIVSRADGSYYVHTSTTASRTNKGKTYVTISDHLSQSSVKDGGYISGAKYDTLAEGLVPLRVPGLDFTGFEVLCFCCRPSGLSSGTA